MVMVCEEVTPTNVTSSVSSSMHILLDSTYVKNLQNAHVVFRILPEEEEVYYYHAKIMAFKIVCDITASYCFKKDFVKNLEDSRFYFLVGTMHTVFPSA